MKFLKNMDTRYYDYNLTPEQKPIEKIVNSERLGGSLKHKFKN